MAFSFCADMLGRPIGQIGFVEEVCCLTRACWGGAPQLRVRLRSSCRLCPSKPCPSSSLRSLRSLLRPHALKPSSSPLKPLKEAVSSFSDCVQTGALLSQGRFAPIPLSDSNLLVFAMCSSIKWMTLNWRISLVFFVGSVSFCIALFSSRAASFQVNQRFRKMQFLVLDSTPQDFIDGENFIH